MTVEEMRHAANRPWNKLGRLPLHKWLCSDSERPPHDADRLKEIGNVVMPQCCRLALHCMGHRQKFLLSPC